MLLGANSHSDCEIALCHSKRLLADSCISAKHYKQGHIFGTRARQAASKIFCAVLCNAIWVMSKCCLHACQAACTKNSVRQNLVFVAIESQPCLSFQQWDAEKRLDVASHCWKLESFLEFQTRTNMCGMHMLESWPEVRQLICNMSAKLLTWRARTQQQNCLPAVSFLGVTDTANSEPAAH